MYYTSYFANIKNIDAAKYTLVSITNKKPYFCNDLILDWNVLGPTKSLLESYKKGEIDDIQYSNIYLTYLEQHWNSLRRYFEDDYFKKQNIVMLCYEKPPKFCHRHLLSKFLKEKGIDCEELPYDIQR